MIVKRRCDVAKHDQAGEGCCKSAEPEVSLRTRQLLVMALSEAGFEPVGEIC